MRIARLVGSGDRIGRATLPFLLAGVALNVLSPSFFAVGGPSVGAKVLAVVLLVPGITLWAWSVALILRFVPRHELITTGPYALMKHPLYTSVALLVLPGVGFLLDTWLGVALGLVLYAASRRFSPEEERDLARTFGAEWEAYARRVWLPWL